VSLAYIKLGVEQFWSVSFFAYVQGGLKKRFSLVKYPQYVPDIIGVIFSERVWSELPCTTKGCTIKQRTNPQYRTKVENWSVKVATYSKLSG
jgi:hypothetical protein